IPVLRKHIQSRHQNLFLRSLRHQDTSQKATDRSRVNMPIHYFQKTPEQPFLFRKEIALRRKEPNNKEEKTKGFIIMT
ncbi:MAG: hypothetical protein IJI53_05300, partial [Clostridia bacterium]|nr:hypothetical protein [Clostridia bacterium]